MDGFCRLRRLAVVEAAISMRHESHIVEHSANDGGQLYWLLGPWLIVTLAFGGIIVPKLELILQLVCKQHLTEMANKDPNFSYIPIVLGGDDNDQCRTPEVQALVAQFTLYCSLVGGLLAAVISPKLGALSDRYGRKKLMLITNLGMISGEVVTILCAKYPETFPVQWIIASYAIDGLCGSFIAAMALANSYATDCTPPAQRSSGFALFHGCLFTGVAVGPIIAGVITEKTGTVLTVFYIMVAAHSSFVLFLMFVIPESLSKARQQAAREKYRQEQAELGPAADWINQIRGFNLFAPLKILLPSGRGTSATLRRNMFFLAATDTTMFGVAMGSMTVVIIYTNYEFGWKTPESARYMSIVNTCRVTCLVVILPLITRLVRGPGGNRQKRHTGADLFDLTVIRFAVLFDTLGYLGYTLARDGTLFTLSGMLASVGGVGSPMLQSALTKSVPPDRTGQLLGATGLLHALARVVAPTVFNAIYKATVGGFTQTVFVCLTATFGVAFLLSWFVRPHGEFFLALVVHARERGWQEPAWHFAKCCVHPVRQNFVLSHRIHEAN